MILKEGEEPSCLYWTAGMSDGTGAVTVTHAAQNGVDQVGGSYTRHWGLVAGSGDDPNASMVLESNLFPNISYWYSITFTIIGSGILRAGLLSYDPTYQDPVFTPAGVVTNPQDHPVHYVNLGTTTPNLDTGSPATLRFMVAPNQGVEHKLRLELDTNDTTFYITDVLVDAHEGQNDFFFGETSEGLPQDYRWHGQHFDPTVTYDVGYEPPDLRGQQFSLWYNNYLNTDSRLFGHYEDGAYVPGLLEEWIPTGASVEPHWEAVAPKYPQNWIGNAFYPIQEVLGILPEVLPADTSDLYTEYARSILVETGPPLESE